MKSQRILTFRINRLGKKGFTLIELLIVIAIIAILVVIVIVAINPLERLNEANDRRAAANVRASATLIAACVTRNSVPGLNACDTAVKVNSPAGGDGRLSCNTCLTRVGPIGATTEICYSEIGRPGISWVYRQSTGDITQEVPPIIC